MKDQTRRTFMIDSAKMTGAAIGATILGKGLLLPQDIEAANVQFPESNCGLNKNGAGGHKMLIAYASKFGTTSEVAEAIGEILCREGNTVEVKWVKTVKDLRNYDAVIIGSAIQYDKWMSEATEFVKANQIILNRMPVAYFFTCLVLSKHTAKAEHKAKAYSEKLFSLVPHVKPVSVGRFAGVLDYSKMSFFSRQIFKITLSIMGVQEGDYRDWDAIRSWAKSMHFALTNEQT